MPRREKRPAPGSEGEEGAEGRGLEAEVEVPEEASDGAEVEEKGGRREGAARRRGSRGRVNRRLAPGYLIVLGLNSRVTQMRKLTTHCKFKGYATGVL